MIDELIHPNWHVIFLHYPLGLLTIGIVIELLSFLWKGSSVRLAARWMILLGALLCLPTLTTGIYAFADAAKGASANSGGTWQQVVAASRWGNEQWLFMTRHLLIMSIASGLILAAVVAWIGCSDHWRNRLHWGFLAALVIGLGGMAVGAWYSGEGVYRYGVAVAPQSTPNTAVPGGPETSANPTTAPATQAVPAHGEHSAGLGVDPAQVHLLLAGFTLAFAMGAIALTIRRWTVGPRIITEATDGSNDVARGLVSPPPAGDTIPLEDAGRVETRENLSGTYGEGPVSPAMSGGSTIYPVGEPPRVYAARWWMLTALLALLTAVAGLWLVEGLNWKLPETQELMRKAFSPEGRQSLTTGQSRLLLHVVLGISILLLPLVLALLTRFSRKLLWITIIGLVLLAGAVGAQIWMGVLLLYNMA